VETISGVFSVISSFWAGSTAPTLLSELIISSFTVLAFVAFTSPMHRCCNMNFMFSSSPPMRAWRSHSFKILDTRLDGDLSYRLLAKANTSDMSMLPAFLFLAPFTWANSCSISSRVGLGSNACNNIFSYPSLMNFEDFGRIPSTST
jgi:hypothetical protein